MLSQKRLLEKRGILIFTAEERKALDLQVHVIVKQIPLKGQSWNYRIYPNRSWFGWATLMIGVSTYKDVELQFLNQCIYHNSRAVEQGAGTDMNNFDTILSALQTLSVQITPPLGVVSKLPTVPIVYGLCPLTSINFELPEGVVIEVQTHILPLSESASIFVEELTNSSPPPGDDGGKKTPPQQPPPGSPPSTKRQDDLVTDAPFVISPPYDGIDDGGRTYQPPFVPPWIGDDGQDATKRYRVQYQETWYSPTGGDLNDVRFGEKLNVPGKILGLGTRQPNNPDGSYGILTTNPSEPLIYMCNNYQVKIAWPYPDFTSYMKIKIISVLPM